MKKFLSLFLVIVISISQGNSQKAMELNLMETAKIEQITDFNLTKSVTEIFNELNVDAESLRNETGIPFFARENFDFVNLYKCSIKDIDVIAVVAPFRSTGNAGSFAFVAFQNSSGLSMPMLIRVTTDMNSISYYDLSGGGGVTAMISGDNVSTKISKVSLSLQNGKILNSNKVIDCIHDMFHKYSLRSLWSWVHTTLMPTSSIVYALICIGQKRLAE